jgi:hypothetical protein
MTPGPPRLRGIVPVAFQARFTPQRKPPLSRFSAARRVSFLVSAQDQQTLRLLGLLLPSCRFARLHGLSQHQTPLPIARLVPAMPFSLQGFAPYRNMFRLPGHFPSCRWLPSASGAYSSCRASLLTKRLAFLVVSSSEVSPQLSPSRASPRVPP